MKDGSFHFGYKMISLSVHLFNTIMIILLPTAFPFTQTAPFTNLQLDTTTTPPDLSSLQTRHHHTSHLDSSSLYTCKAVYHFSTDHRNHNVHLRTQPRRHHHPAPSHNPHPDGAHHRQLPRAAHRSRAGDLPALRAQAERERASGAGSLHGVRGLRRQQGSQDAACRLPPAACRLPRPQDGCALQKEIGWRSGRRRKGLRRRGPRPIVLSICIGGR